MHYNHDTVHLLIIILAGPPDTSNKLKEEVEEEEEIMKYVIMHIIITRILVERGKVQFYGAVHVGMHEYTVHIMCWHQ